MIDKSEAVEQAQREFARLKESYKRAIEAALAKVPVRDGVVSARDLWLETSLPLDLIEELLKENGIKLPPHVRRVDLPPKGKGRRGRRK
jgi:hypothetical protein